MKSTYSLSPIKKVRNQEDKNFLRVLRTFGYLTIAALMAMILILLFNSFHAFKVFGLSFLTTSEWNPVTEQFSALAFIYGTLVSSFLAILLATPVSIAAAVVLTEIAERKTASIFGFLIEMLAAIPSVVYGLWGIFVLAPWLRETTQPWPQTYFGFLPLFQGPPFGVGMLAAGIILAIMITPTITAICREVFKTVPNPQREAVLALGGTRWEMIRMGVIRSSLSGIMGAVVLGLGRALGETMAVTMVIGNQNRISASLFSPAQTMASVIANEYAEATSDIHLSALAAIGLALLVVSLIINSGARALIWKIDQK